MSAAALTVYMALRSEGSQESVLGLMQTRKELYGYLNYEAFEEKQNLLLQKEKPTAKDD
jgi:methylisocitrate lyase